MTTAETAQAQETLTGDYTLDFAHTRVGFWARHAMVSKVRGQFNKFDGSVHLDAENPANSHIELTIQAASIDTRNPDRDAHLRSNDFFAMEEHPEITFRSTHVAKTSDNNYDVTGDLTIHGVTKPVVLKVTLLAFGPGMRGAQLSGWEAETSIKRTDFGVNGPPGASAILGDDVAISISVEADLKKDADAPK